MRNKAQTHVFAAVQRARRRLPFPLLGIDSDNGSEFINNELYRYCQQEHITFTRTRAGRKNDNAHVEQKNWSVVRRAVGYGGYDTLEQQHLLNRLYRVLCLYINQVESLGTHTETRRHQVFCFVFLVSLCEACFTFPLRFFLAPR